LHQSFKNTFNTMAKDEVGAAKATEPEVNNAGDSDSDSEEEGEEEKATEAPTKGGDRYDRLERLKREKRLAQNRDCARARRRRKKIRMDTLENRVQALTQQNVSLQGDNEALLVRVTQLEGELRRVTAMASGGMGMGGMPSANTFLNASKFGGGHAAPFFDQEVMAQIQLQRRAAMVGLGGAATGLGGPNSMTDPSSQMLYLQLMQQQQGKLAMGGGAGFQSGQHGGDKGGAGGGGAGTHQAGN
jgi:bZIP transcription factor